MEGMCAWKALENFPYVLLCAPPPSADWVQIGRVLRDDEAHDGSIWVTE